jgi:hypothetical protein
MKQHTTLFVAVLVALSSVLVVGAVTAAGSDATTDVEVLNKTVSVSDTTEGLRVVGSNITNNTASVTIASVNETGATSQVKTGTLDTSTSDTAQVEYNGVNSTKFSEYRVIVMGDSASDTVEVNTIEVVGAGGGLIPGGGSLGMIVLVAVGAYFLVGRD